MRKLFKWFAYALLLVLIFLGIMILIPVAPTIAPIQPRESTQYWMLESGHQIAYTKISGQSELPRTPIIFLHGGPGYYIHSATISGLSGLSEYGFDVYLYDQIGSGLSERLKDIGGYSFEGHLDDLHEIIQQHVASDQVVLIGQSAGANLAAHYLARYPEQVAAVIFTAPGGIEPEPWVDGHRVSEGLYPVPEHLEFRSPATGVDSHRGPLQIGARGLAAGIMAQFFDIKLISDSEVDGIQNSLVSGFSHMAACDPDRAPAEEGGVGFYVYLKSNWFPDLVDPRPVLKSMDTPALVLHGQCDFIPYDVAYEFADLLSGDYRFIADAGHEIWWEKPEVFVTEIAEFLDDVRKGSDP